MSEAVLSDHNSNEADAGKLTEGGRGRVIDRIRGASNPTHASPNHPPPGPSSNPTSGSASGPASGASPGSAAGGTSVAAKAIAGAGAGTGGQGRPHNEAVASSADFAQVRSIAWDGPAPVAAAGLVPADGHAAGGEAALTAASTAALPAPRQTSQNHAPAAAYPADDATADGALPAVHGETGMTRTWRAHDRAGTPVLDVRTVSFKYANKRILREVDFAIYPGEIMVLLGPNGAGKSTLAKLITGRNTPASGRIRIQSGDPTTDADARAAIGIVPQQVAVYPKLTALENLIAFGRLLGLPAALADTAARKNLRRVGLEDRTHARVDTLSGGMQRRVNIAAALLHNPKLLVLDEPTVGVDLASRTALADVLKDLRTEGLAIMLTTHDLTEAETLADRITVLVQGQVVAQGTPDSVIAEAFGGRRHLTVSVSPASAAMNARGPDGRVGSVSMHTRQAYDTTLITRLRDAAGRMGLTSEDGGMTWSGLIDVSDPQVRGGMQEILAASPVTRDVRLRRPGLDALLQHLTPGAPQSRDGAALTDRSDVSPV